MPEALGSIPAPKKKRQKKKKPLPNFLIHKTMAQPYFAQPFGASNGIKYQQYFVILEV
jgi:hypothetical protein